MLVCFPVSAIYSRVRMYGWNAKWAVWEPPRAKGRRYEIQSAMYRAVHALFFGGFSTGLSWCSVARRSASTSVPVRTPGALQRES